MESPWLALYVNPSQKESHKNLKNCFSKIPKSFLCSGTSTGPKLCITAEQKGNDGVLSSNPWMGTQQGLVQEVGYVCFPEGQLGGISLDCH